MTLLCVARCRPADRGGSREAAPGYRLCWMDLDRMTEKLNDLIRLVPDLDAALSRFMAAMNEKVSGTPGWSVELNDTVARMRWQIHYELTTTVRLVIEERGLSAYPANAIAPMATWTLGHVPWLAAHKSAGERCDEMTAWAGMAMEAINPNPPKVVQIGPCVMVNCPGVLSAVVRPQDSLLPSAIVCSWWRDLEDKTDIEPHAWPADQWHALGRAMTRRSAA